MRSLINSLGRLQRFRILAEITLVYVLGFLLTRIGLLFWFAEWRQLSIGNWLSILQAGLRFDLLIALLGIQVQLWHFTWSQNRWLKSRASQWLIDESDLRAISFDSHDEVAVMQLQATIHTLIDRWNIPKRLSVLGVTRAQLPALVQGSHGNSLDGNPRDISDGELQLVLETML